MSESPTSSTLSKNEGGRVGRSATRASVGSAPAGGAALAPTPTVTCDAVREYVRRASEIAGLAIPSEGGCPGTPVQVVVGSLESAAADAAYELIGRVRDDYPSADLDVWLIERGMLGSGVP